jgi:hypothetical protein
MVWICQKVEGMNMVEE